MANSRTPSLAQSQRFFQFLVSFYEMSRFSTSTPRAKTPIQDRQRHTAGISTGGRTSFAAPVTSARRSSFFRQLTTTSAFKEIRQINSQSWRQSEIKKIHDFMQGELTLEDFKSPSRKNFTYMFEYIYNTFDENFRIQGRIEDEVPAILKTMGYPATIKASTLQAIGAPTSWPHLVAALGWMVDLAQFFESINSMHDALLDTDESDGYIRSLTYAQVSATCKDYFKNKTTEGGDVNKMDDNVNRLTREFEVRLRARYNPAEELSELEAREAQLLEEIRALEEEKEADPGPALKGEIKKIEDDISRFVPYLEQVEEQAKAQSAIIREKRSRNDEINGRIQREKAEIEGKKAEIAATAMRCGLDGAAIRAMALEKKDLCDAMKCINEELQNLSRKKYKLAPQAKKDLDTAHTRCRRLITALYDVRSNNIGHEIPTLINQIPNDLKAITDLVNDGVKRLMARTITELEKLTSECESEERMVLEKTRRVGDEEGRIDAEITEQKIAIEKEDRQRAKEREEWSVEAGTKDRERRMMIAQKEALQQMGNNASSIQQQLEAAQLELAEAEQKTTSIKNEHRAILTEKAMQMMNATERIHTARQKIHDSVGEMAKEHAAAMQFMDVGKEN